MKSPKNRRILLSGYLMMRETWPWGLGEVIANALGPVVNRIVFMVLLLSNFKYFSKHVEPHMAYAEVFQLALPILLSVVAVMILPGLVETLGFVSRRKRKKKTTQQLKQKYCYILFGSTQINGAWKDVWQGQLLVLEYIAYFVVLSPVFLYFSWQIFANMIIVANVYVWVCAVVQPNGSRGKLNRVLGASFFVVFMKNFFFCVYLLNSALIIWATAGRFPIEFLFILIVGMRLLMRKAAALGAMLRSGQFGMSGSARGQLDRLD